MTATISGIDLFDLELLKYEAEVVGWSQRLLHEGIDHIILKGSGFDRWLARSRVPRDIDVLVPRWRLRRVADLLTAAGYRRASTEPTATTWVGPAGTIPIDVHESFKAIGASHAEVWEACVATRTWIDMGQRSIPVEGSPLRELHVVLHLAHAGLDDQRARDDLERAIEITPIGQWRPVLDLATELRCRPVVAAVLTAVPAAEPVCRALHLGDGPAGWLSGESPSREHAMSMLSVTLQSGVLERLRMTARLCRLHPTLAASASSPEADGQTRLAHHLTAYGRRGSELRAAAAMTLKIHREVRS